MVMLVGVTPDHRSSPRRRSLVMLVGVTSQHDTESSGIYIHAVGMILLCESVECGSGSR